MAEKKGPKGRRPAAGKQRGGRPEQSACEAATARGDAPATRALLIQTAQVLGLVLSFEHPADAVVSRYFREHRQLGHADRAFVAETVFAVLRRGRSIEARCGGELSDRHRLLATLAIVRGWSQRELAPVLKASEEAWLASLKAAADADLPPAVRCDLPDWLYARLESQYGADEVVPLAAALNQPAPLDLRANTLKLSRDTLLERLAAEGIAANVRNLRSLDNSQPPNTTASQTSAPHSADSAHSAEGENNPQSQCQSHIPQTPHIPQGNADFQTPQPDDGEVL